MEDLYKPCDFSSILGYSHVIPDKALEKLPSLQGNNAITAKTHLRNFNACIAKWCTNHNHEDTKMKLFIFSLEEDALDWFLEHDDNTFDSLKRIVDAFYERYGDMREDRYLLVALYASQKMENETMEEFNKRFNDLVKNLDKKIKPPEDAILLHYMDSFDGEIRDELRDKEPSNLKEAQKLAIKIEKNMQFSRKSNLLGFTTGTTSKSHEGKKKS